MKGELGSGIGGSMRRRVLRGIGSQAIGQPVALLIQIAGVPLYLAFWGVDLYGEWLILAALPAYLSMSDLGFTTATTQAMTMQVASGNRDAALASFRTGWAVITSVSLLVAAIVFLAVPRLPLMTWFNFSLLGAQDTALILTLFTLQAVLILQTGMLKGGFHCEGEYGQGLAFLALARLVEFLLAVVVLVAGGDPVAVAAAFVAGRLAVALVMLIRLRRIVPWISVGLAGVGRRTVRELFRPALGFTGYVLGNALSIQGPVIVIGAVLGPAAVVPFATTRTLTRVVQQLLQSISTIVRPEIGIAFGRADLDLTRRLNRDACRLALWLVAGATVALLLVGETVVEVWTSGRVVPPQPLLDTMLLVMIAASIWQASAWTMQAINRVQQQAAVYIVANAIALTAIALLVGPFGLEAAALALLAADITMAAFVLSRTLAFLDEPVGRFVRALAIPPFDILRQLRGGSVWPPAPPVE